ncbi:type II secretion system F family protein [Aeromonas jandaei]|uniref:type II secretion system F family protein n=1 Tax=Aeromonas jandaei TaxID=650 RepID=UPI001ABFEEFD|nr:type II secretion system F family protein [Aeromonas jandaei]QSR71968.1 type II secretion system F family protein [Aeromonas jandaei]
MACYQAQLLKAGKIEFRLIHAPDEMSARGQICQADEQLLSLKRQRDFKQKRTRGKGFALAVWLQEMSALLEAGLSLVEALEALRDKSGGPSSTQRAVLEGLLNTLYQGRPLSLAMEQQPAVFPALLAATVASAEGSGQLPNALRRYQHYAVRIDTLRKRMIGALVYPSVVMIVGLGILLFMLFFVIPSFASVFESLDSLPPTAEIMLWWAGQVQTRGIEIVIGMTLLLIVGIILVRSSPVQIWLYKLPWRIPRIKEIAHWFVLARFYRSVGLLLAGGMPLLSALMLSRGLLPKDYEIRLATAQELLRAGQSVADTLAGQKLTTPVAERLLRAGEQGGNLSDMCERIAQFHDGALDQALEVFSKVFEPILMLGVGGLVGVIVTLLYMPIFELAGSVG